MSSDPGDKLVEQLSRALSNDGPDPSLVEATKALPQLHIDGEIVGTEEYDTADGVRTTGVRFRSSDERDLLYTFGDPDDPIELAVRFANGAMMARLPETWAVKEVFVQSTTSRVDADVDDDNYVLCFGPFSSPLRLVVSCDNATYCTPWTIA